MSLTSGVYKVIEFNCESVDTHGRLANLGQKWDTPTKETWKVGVRESGHVVRVESTSGLACLGGLPELYMGSHLAWAYSQSHLESDPV